MTFNVVGIFQNLLITTISRDYREWSEKERISSGWQFCGWKWLVDAKVQRMARLDRADRRATVTQITTRYNRGVQKSIYEHTTHRIADGQPQQKTTPGATPVRSTGFLNMTDITTHNPPIQQNTFGMWWKGRMCVSSTLVNLCHK